MRVLTALTYYRPHYSGLTIYAERQARALASRGHQITILTSRFDKSLPMHEVMNGIEIVRPNVWMRISKGVIMPSMPHTAWKLISKADIVQLHVPQLDAAPIAVLSRLMGKPVVLTYHCDLQLPSGLVHKAANLASNLANHIAARAAHVIVTNTSDYAEHSPFLCRYIKKIHPIYPPVELLPVDKKDILEFRDKFNLHPPPDQLEQQPLDKSGRMTDNTIQKRSEISGGLRRKVPVLPGQRLIGMAARLASEKGVEYLARALPQVLERFPDSRVLFVGPFQNVVGEVSYAQRVFGLIEGLGGHWSFLGILDPREMAAFFHVCDVTVLPSINSTESFGMVQVESLSCNTPVVSTNMPGVRVPVGLTGSGLIVPPADPHELAQALIAILENPTRYTGNPEAIVQLCQPVAVAGAYEALFQNLLTNPPGKSRFFRG